MPETVRKRDLLRIVYLGIQDLLFTIFMIIVSIRLKRLLYKSININIEKESKDYDVKRCKTTWSVK